MKKRKRFDPEFEEKKLPEFTIDVPHDIINEQVILAAEIVDPDVRKKGVKLFPPDAFYADEHKYIQQGLIELTHKNLDYDPAVLVRLVPDIDIRLLERYTDSRPEVPKNIDFHFQNLQWDWHRAKVVQGPFAALLEAIQNPKEAQDKVRSLARQVGEAFQASTSSTRYLRNTNDVIREMMSNLRKRVAGLAHYPFGIHGLDYNESGERRLPMGAAPGMITTLTGMSGSGKTSLAAHIVLGLARQRKKVLVGAWEVRAPMTMELLAIISLGWSRKKFFAGEFTEEELQFVYKRVRKIAPYVQFIENPFQRGSVRAKGRVTNDDYLDILQTHIEASRPDVCLWDLFDRCLRWRKPDDEQEALYRQLEMADETQTHHINVHQQLVKGADVRSDKKPSIAGLKGSSAYTDVSTQILAPHLPALFKNVPNDTLELYGLKSRHSVPFGIEFDWDGDRVGISGGRDISYESSDEAEDEAFGNQPTKSGRDRGRRSRS